MAESATSVGSLTFFGLFAMFCLSPLVRIPSEAFARPQASTAHHAFSGASGTPGPRPACPLHPQTSYWLGDANEMVAINTILIIVNGRPVQRLRPEAH